MKLVVNKERLRDFIVKSNSNVKLETLAKYKINNKYHFDSKDLVKELLCENNENDVTLLVYFAILRNVVKSHLFYNETLSDNIKKHL